MQHGLIRGLVVALTSGLLMGTGGLAMAQSTTVVVPVSPAQYRTSAPSPHGTPSIHTPAGLICGMTGPATETYPVAVVTRSQLDSINQVTTSTTTMTVTPPPTTTTVDQLETHTITVTHTSSSQVLVSAGHTVQQTFTQAVYHPPQSSTSYVSEPVYGEIPHTSTVSSTKEVPSTVSVTIDHTGSKWVPYTIDHSSTKWVPYTIYHTGSKWVPYTIHHSSTTHERAWTCHSYWVGPRTVAYRVWLAPHPGMARRSIIEYHHYRGYEAHSCGYQMRTFTTHWTTTGYRPVTTHWTTTGYRPVTSHWTTTGYKPVTTHWTTTSTKTVYHPVTTTHTVTTYSRGVVGTHMVAESHTTPGYTTYQQESRSVYVPPTYRTVQHTYPTTETVSENVPVTRQVLHPPYTTTQISTHTVVEGTEWIPISTQTVAGSYTVQTQIAGDCPVPTN